MEALAGGSRHGPAIWDCMGGEGYWAESPVPAVPALPSS